MISSLNDILLTSFDNETYIQCLVYMKQNATSFRVDANLIKVYRRLVLECVRRIEIDKKCIKKLAPGLLSSVIVIPDNNDLVTAVAELVFNLPIMLQSRWELTMLLIAGKIISELPRHVFEELLCCAKDQDCCARSSILIAHMATTSAHQQAAQVIFRGLASSCSSTRSNVRRSWLARIMVFKSAQQCIEEICAFARGVVVDLVEKPVWPLLRRELQGISCLDLEWRDRYDKEPYDDQHFAFLAYFDVLLGCTSANAQCKVETNIRDSMVTLGIDFYSTEVSRKAFLVCQKYNIYPKNLEKAVLHDFGTTFDQELVDIVDLKMFASFSEQGKSFFVREKTRIALENEVTKSKFYPHEDTGKITIETPMDNEMNALITMKKILEFQGEEQYPSVAAVMEVLRDKEIDERYYVQRLKSLLDAAFLAFKNRTFSRDTTARFVFGLITRCPLRSIVDYGGAIVMQLSKIDLMFKEKVFRMALALLQEKEENSRPLLLEVVFLSTAWDDEQKLTEVWYACTNLVGKKRGTMLEMIARLIIHTQIKVGKKDLEEMLYTGLGFNDNSVICTQLFAAALSKMLDMSNENSRIPLFVAISEKPNVLSIISYILKISPDAFTKASIHLTLHMISRFVVVDEFFYEEYVLREVKTWTKFVEHVLYNYCYDPIMVSAAVDAFCGILPWNNIRKYAYSSDYLLSEHPVDKLIASNLKSHFYWSMLHETLSKENYATIKDVENLPSCEMIPEVLNATSPEQLEKLLSKLRKKVQQKSSSTITHANSYTLALITDKALAMRKDAKKCRNSHVRRFINKLLEYGNIFDRVEEAEHEMADAWLGKALCKQEYLRKFN